jgi:hypothetical protein
MFDLGSLEGERESMLTVGETERLEKAPRKRKSYRLKRIKTPAKKKSSAAVSYNDAKHQHSTKRVNDHLDMSQIIQAINLNLLIKLNEGSNTYSDQIPWNRIGRNDMVNWPEDVPVKKILLQGRKNLKEIYTNLDRIQFTKEFLNNWAARLNRMARVPSPLPVKGSQLNNSPSYKSYKMPYISADEFSEGSASMSDSGDVIHRAVHPFRGSVTDPMESTVYEWDEIPELLMQDGIYFYIIARTFL